MVELKTLNDHVITIDEVDGEKYLFTLKLPGCDGHHQILFDDLEKALKESGLSMVETKRLSFLEAISKKVSEQGYFFKGDSF